MFAKNKHLIKTLINLKRKTDDQSEVEKGGQSEAE